MKFRSGLALLVLLLLAGCGGASKPSEPQDAALKQDARAGQLAFSLRRPEEAAKQYEAALARARERDDAPAIGDYGYNLAVAQLAANHPKQALASARMTRKDLARRDESAFPGLYLVEATALYRIGENQAADQLAEHVQETGDAAVAARATFLRGLIADKTNNAEALDAALAWLERQPDPSRSATQRADLAELQARRDCRNGSFAAAAIRAEQAADLRRTEMDYRGMARALVVAADAAAGVNDRQAAANLYMRAGQSAAVQGDAEAARSWLRQALALGHDPAMRQSVRQALAALSDSGNAPARE